MDNFLTHWKNDEFKWFIVVTLISIVMMFYLYKRYKRTQNDDDLGKGSEIIALGNYWEFVIIVFFLILAIITRMKN